MTRSRVPVLPYQRLELAEYSLSKELTEQAVYYVRDGQTWAAADGIAHCLIDSRTFWSLAGRALLLPGICQLARVVYFWVATNRHRLPGGTPECRIS